MGSAEEEHTTQSTFLAKPCCCISGDGPNRGKQIGIPPEMGLDLSHTASGRTKRTSSPLGWHLCKDKGEEGTVSPKKNDIVKMISGGASRTFRVKSLTTT